MHVLFCKLILAVNNFEQQHCFTNHFTGLYVVLCNGPYQIANMYT